MVLPRSYLHNLIVFKWDVPCEGELVLKLLTYAAVYTLSDISLTGVKHEWKLK
jgi:hypothetical protein